MATTLSSFNLCSEETMACLPSSLGTNSGKAYLKGAEYMRLSKRPKREGAEA
jgi:hypothetical protein